MKNIQDIFSQDESNKPHSSASVDKTKAKAALAELKIIEERININDKRHVKCIKEYLDVVINGTLQASGMRNAAEYAFHKYAHPFIMVSYYYKYMSKSYISTCTYGLIFQ